MASIYTKLLLSMLIGTTSLIHICHAQRLLLEVGPRNITRTEGEKNVYIPCPFTGSYSPIWVINGDHYEAFNLPENMFSVSFGLLITSVTADMDGKSFQCIVPTGVNCGCHRSSVGILYVEKTTLEEYHSINTGATTFSLNHQRMIFEDNVKAISWTNADGCNGYRLNSSKCDTTPVFSWDENVIQGNSVPIPSTSLVDANNVSVFLKLNAVNRYTHTVCQELLPEIIIEKNDTTDEKLISLDGFCVTFRSIVGPYIVLPRRSGGNDCPCSIIINMDNTYELSKCSCSDDTVFKESFLAFQWQYEESAIYNICFRNLSREMNYTIIHFYELYRTCDDYNDRPRLRPYRRYFTSFKIMIVLPDPPDVNYSKTTGQINFSSQYSEGILLDHYQVIVADVTNQIVVNVNVTASSNNISVGDLFLQQTCSPYILIVQAHNAHGFTEYNSTIISNSSNPGDECKCILQYIVNPDLNLVNGDSGVSVQVNCSQSHYKSEILLNVTVQQNGVYINSTQFSCDNGAVSSNLDSLIKCDNSYDLFLFWVATDENDIPPCLLNQASNKMIPCPDKPGGLLLPLQYIIITIAFIVALLIIVLLIGIIIYMYRVLKKSKLTFNKSS